MTEQPDSILVQKAAEAATAQPMLLGWSLAPFREGEQLDQTGLAHWLGIETARLPWLYLCGKPRPEAFQADVSAIAARFSIAPFRLASLLRQVEALIALQGRHRAIIDTTLAAARDYPIESDETLDSSPMSIRSDEEVQ